MSNQAGESQDVNRTPGANAAQPLSALRKTAEDVVDALYAEGLLRGSREDALRTYQVLLEGRGFVSLGPEPKGDATARVLIETARHLEAAAYTLRSLANEARL